MSNFTSFLPLLTQRTLALAGLSPLLLGSLYFWYHWLWSAKGPTPVTAPPKRGIFFAYSLCLAPWLVCTALALWNLNQNPVTGESLVQGFLSEFTGIRDLSLEWVWDRWGMGLSLFCGIFIFPQGFKREVPNLKREQVYGPSFFGFDHGMLLFFVFSLQLLLGANNAITQIFSAGLLFGALVVHGLFSGSSNGKSLLGAIPLAALLILPLAGQSLFLDPLVISTLFVFCLCPILGLWAKAEPDSREEGFFLPTQNILTAIVFIALFRKSLATIPRDLGTFLAPALFLSAIFQTAAALAIEKKGPRAFGRFVLALGTLYLAGMTTLVTLEGQPKDELLLKLDYFSFFSVFALLAFSLSAFIVSKNWIFRPGEGARAEAALAIIPVLGIPGLASTVGFALVFSQLQGNLWVLSLAGLAFLGIILCGFKWISEGFRDTESEKVNKANKPTNVSTGGQGVRLVGLIFLFLIQLCFLWTGSLIGPWLAPFGIQDHSSSTGWGTEVFLGATKAVEVLLVEGSSPIWAGSFLGALILGMGLAALRGGAVATFKNLSKAGWFCGTMAGFSKAVELIAKLGRSGLSFLHFVGPTLYEATWIKDWILIPTAKGLHKITAFIEPGGTRLIKIGGEFLRRVRIWAQRNRAGGPVYRAFQIVFSSVSTNQGAQVEEVAQRGVLLGVFFVLAVVLLSFFAGRLGL